MFTAHSMHILFIFLPTLSALLHHCGPRGHFYFLEFAETSFMNLETLFHGES